MDVKVIRTKFKRKGHVGGFIFQASKHIWVLVLFAVLFVGLICGNFLLKSSENTYETVKLLFEDYLSSLSGQTLMRNFSTQLVINFAFLLVSFIFGLCAIGFPVPIIINLIKGISIGALSAFMYSQFALKGFGYCMLVFYPVQIVLSVVTLYSGKESFTMSVSIFKHLTGQRQTKDSLCDIKLYALRYLVLSVITAIASFISAVLSVYVTKLFDF